MFVNRAYWAVVVQQPIEGVSAYKVNFKVAVTLCKEYIGRRKRTAKLHMLFALANLILTDRLYPAA